MYYEKLFLRKSTGNIGVERLKKKITPCSCRFEIIYAQAVNLHRHYPSSLSNSEAQGTYILYVPSLSGEYNRLSRKDFACHHHHHHHNTFVPGDRIYPSQPPPHPTPLHVSPIIVSAA